MYVRQRQSTTPNFEEKAEIKITWLNFRDGETEAQSKEAVLFTGLRATVSFLCYLMA